MSGYTTREVAELLGLSPARVRRLARSASLQPGRAPRSWYRFEFRDLVLLRTALALERGGISEQRIHRSLRRLKNQLPEDRPLTALRITSAADGLVARDGDLAWNPESGQVHLDLETRAAPVEERALDRRRVRLVDAPDREPGAEEWYELGCALQVDSPQQAERAFRRALELDPGHADAQVNLGVLLHERGDFEAAELCYRLALRATNDNATASYNLGVVLEDQGLTGDAVTAYEEAIAADEGLADAHYNLSRLYEQIGDRAAALRHLRSYGDLVQPTEEA